MRITIKVEDFSLKQEFLMCTTWCLPKWTARPGSGTLSSQTQAKCVWVYWENIWCHWLSSHKDIKDVVWGLNSLLTDLLHFDDPLNTETVEHHLRGKEDFWNKTLHQMTWGKDYGAMNCVLEVWFQPAPEGSLHSGPCAASVPLSFPESCDDSPEKDPLLNCPL